MRLLTAYTSLSVGGVLWDFLHLHQHVNWFFHGDLFRSCLGDCIAEIFWVQFPIIPLLSCSRRPVSLTLPFCLLLHDVPCLVLDVVGLRCIGQGQAPHNQLLSAFWLVLDSLMVSVCCKKRHPRWGVRAALLCGYEDRHLECR